MDRKTSRRSPTSSQCVESIPRHQSSPPQGGTVGGDYRRALKDQNTKNALVNLSQRLPADKMLQSFDAEGEFSQRERSLGPQEPRSQPGEILVGRRCHAPFSDTPLRPC